MRDMIDRQFSEASWLKSELLRYVEDSLVTNDAETAYLSERKLKSDNWFEAKKQLAVADVPHQFSRKAKTNHDRLVLLEYLIGRREEMPDSVLGRYAGTRPSDLNGQEHSRGNGLFWDQSRAVPAHVGACDRKA